MKQKTRRKYRPKPGPLNILGTPLRPCSRGTRKQTGFYRNGYCSTGANDHGTHVVCASVTDEFLQFSKSMGNDLITPGPGFPGLVAGDRWCLCANRWLEAYRAGVAPPIIAKATNRVAFQYIPKKILMKFILKKNPS